MNIVAKAMRPTLLCLLLLLSGCFSLNRGAPAQRHYVLGAGAHAGPVEPAVVTEQERSGLTVIGLRPPQVADYLANQFIVVRRGSNRIDFSEFHRWGEDLIRGVNRTLAGHMAARSPALQVETVPWPPGVSPEHLIQVRLLRFEGVAPEDEMATTGGAHLLATWEILGSGDGALLASGTTEVRTEDWSVGDFDGLVRLLDAALETLAEDLILGLERVRGSPGRSRLN